MIKKRLIACLLLMDGQLVESIGFSQFLIIGNAIMAVKHFNAWAVDEIVFLNINRQENFDFWRNDVNYDNTLKQFTDVVKYIGQSCFVPLSVGGGIRTIDDMRAYLSAGADKLVINTLVFENPEIIKEAVRIFGCQCLVVSIDAKKMPNGAYHVMENFGQVDSGKEVVEWSKYVESLGAGEIFLTSVDADGSLKGYDTELITAVAGAVNIPVIASGGVGEWSHLTAGLEAGASAVSVGNKFHFTEHSTMHAKKYLSDHGVEVR